MKKSAKPVKSAAVEPSNNSSQNDNQSAAAPAVIATPYKQQTAKEAIAANVKLLIEQLEQ